MSYNKINRQLIYFSYTIPYYAVYKNNDANFEFVHENNYGEFDYSVNNRNLKVELPNNTPIISEVALLKDYIVTIGNAEENRSEGDSSTQRKKTRFQPITTFFVRT